MKPLIVTLGSCNIDFVIKLARFPLPGETVKAIDVKYYAGGKGANQAVAVARLGGQSVFLGKLGNDEYGHLLYSFLEREGIDMSRVKIEHGVPTGMAIVCVLEKTGENQILYIPGANNMIDINYIRANIDIIKNADILLLQLEIPVNIIQAVISMLKNSDHPVIFLDPAPAENLTGVPLARVDVITPNQQELFLLTGSNDLVQGAQKLLAQGVKMVLCKRGEKGAVLFTHDGKTVYTPAFPVPVVDTTAAGDAFNAAFAVALGEGKSIEEAVIFANAAGAVTVTREGAQPSLPMRVEVEQLMKKHAPKWQGS